MPEGCTDCADKTTTEAVDPRGTKLTRWRTLLAPIGGGRKTGDGRRFRDESLTSRDLPVPLRWVREDGGGHRGAVVIGTTDKIEFREGVLKRRDGSEETVFGAWGEGLMFTPDPDKLPRLAEDVAEARLLIDNGTLGPSVDLDDMEYTVNEDMVRQLAAGTTTKPPEVEVTKGRISAATLVPIAAFADTAPTFELYEIDAEPEEPEGDPDEDQAPMTASVRADGWDELAIIEAGEYDVHAARERIEQWADNPVDYARAFLWTDGSRHLFPLADVVNGALVLSLPAVETALAKLDHSELADPDRLAMRGVLAKLRKKGKRKPASRDDEHDYQYALVAAGGPLRPPKAAFERPEADQRQALTFTDDGQVYGHIADWRTCHAGYGACKTAPRSRTGYAYFHTGEVVLDDGSSLPVGRLTVGAGHADAQLGYRPAMAHYDDATRQVAIGRVRDGRHGIWFSGVRVPEADEHAVAMLRRSAVSGDWRRIGGNLELIAAHGVNSPGWPVVREINSQVFSLVAAGGPPPEEVEPVDMATLADRAAEQAVTRLREREALDRRAVAGLAALRTGLDSLSSVDRSWRAVDAAGELHDGLADLDADTQLAQVLHELPEAEFAALAQAAEELLAEDAETFGSRFQAMMAKLKGKVSNPAAVAASIGRRKYGKAGMAKLRNAPPKVVAAMHHSADRKARSAA